MKISVTAVHQATTANHHYQFPIQIQSSPLKAKMAGFTSVFGSSAEPKKLDPAAEQVKKQLQEQISQELAIANATELVNVSSPQQPILSAQD